MGLNSNKIFCGYCNVINCMIFETILPNMDETAGVARNVTQWKLGKVKAQPERLVSLRTIREFVLLQLKKPAITE